MRQSAGTSAVTSGKTTAVTVSLWTGWAVFSVIVVVILWLRALIYAAPFMGKAEPFMVAAGGEQVTAAVIVSAVAFVITLIVALVARTRRHLSRPGIAAVVASLLSIPGPILFAYLWFM